MNKLTAFDLSKAPAIGTENLKTVRWSHGDFAPLGVNPGPRHAFVAAMSLLGNQKAIFSDGEEHPYFRMLAIIHQSGILQVLGGHVIPRFPNGDLLMVIVERPCLAAFDRRNTIIHREGRRPIDMGQTGSLEFAGGSIDPDDSSITLGALREFLEETGVKPGIRVMATERVDLTHLAIGEMILAIKVIEIGLPDIDFPDHVDNDDGFDVIRISRHDLLANEMLGVITAASAESCLHFLQNLRHFRDLMIKEGAIKINEYTLA